MGWQGLFIVAGIGACVIFAGVGFQLLQLAVSILQRKDNRDTTGDPWNGRTLEWSIPSPAPFYNFAVIPDASVIDPFWAAKHPHAPKPKKPEYEDIWLPKNTGMGIFIATFAFLFGFGAVWHIWWMLPLGLLGIITCIVLRASADETEYCITAEEVAKLERQRA
jgi:cytochrome o ubiquinol oxidase subunit 1